MSLKEFDQNLARGIGMLGGFVLLCLTYPFVKLGEAAAFLRNIVWKDIFKHRYGIKTTLQIKYDVTPFTTRSGIKIERSHYYATCVSDRPYKRRLVESYVDFFNRNSSSGGTFTTGHKQQLMRLEGDMKIAKHQWKNPIVYYPSLTPKQLMREHKKGNVYKPL